MKFAINYSPQAEQLWRDGAIQVDLFKCPPWDDLVAQARRSRAVYVHFDLIAGRNQLDDVDLDSLQNWLETTETLIVNTHLAVAAADFAAGERIDAESVIKRAVRDVEYLGERFGNERIALENVPYPELNWDKVLLAEVVDPAVVSEVVKRTGCGLLLDVAHAIRACEGTGRADVRGYLNAMPTRALRELHVTGILPDKDANGLRLDHYALTDEDWAMAEWVVGQIRQGRWRQPDTMAFEYGGVGPLFAHRSESAVIAEQAPRLYRLAQSAAGAS